MEILGDGQQVIVHGIHPDTKEPYRWPYESLVDATPDDLPKVDKKALSRLYEALRGRSQVIDFQEKKDEIERGNKVSEGDRNNTVFKFLRQNAWRMKTKKEMKREAEAFNQTVNRYWGNGSWLQQYKALGIINYRVRRGGLMSNSQNLM